MNIRGRNLALALVGVYTVLLSASALCITKSKVGGRIRYHYASVNLLIEFSKLVASALLYGIHRQTSRKSQRALQQDAETFTWEKNIWFMVPSGIYVINNNLCFHVLNSMLSPAAFQLLSNLRIPITALLFRAILQKRIPPARWVALGLVLVGVMVSEASTAAPLPKTYKISSHTSHSSQAPSTHFVGVLLVVFMGFLAALSDVLTEWIFKRHASDIIHLQNLQLYAYGTLLNAAVLTMVDWDTLASGGFFEDYNGYTIAVICINTVLGLTVSGVLKYVDNIAMVMGHSAATLLTTILSAFVFGHTPNPWFLLGAIIVGIAVYLYNASKDSLDHNHSEDGELQGLLQAQRHQKDTISTHGNGEYHDDWD